MLSPIRKFFARRFHREIDVYRIEDFNYDPPEIIKNITRVKVEHADLEIKIDVINTLSASKPAIGIIECSAKRYNLSASPVKAENKKIKRFVKQDVKTHKIKLVKKPEIFSPLKQLQDLPQERRNILKFQKRKPNVSSNEVILACYGPIVEGATDRLVLNKKGGTLFVWYRSSSRQRKARNVYLIRRLGMESKPEWRWM